MAGVTPALHTPLISATRKESHEVDPGDSLDFLGCPDLLAQRLPKSIAARRSPTRSAASSWWGACCNSAGLYFQPVLAAPLPRSSSPA